MAAAERLPIGVLFPAGGPVRPDLVIGRESEVAEIVRHVQESIHTMVIGPRRIGKTTVCAKACSELGESHVVIRLEVPDQRDPSEFLRLMVERCNGASFRDEGRAALRVAKPWIEGFLKSQGANLDLSGLGGEAVPTPRQVLELPLAVAKAARRPVLLFFDELQRATSYDDDNEILKALVDIYTGVDSVVLLVDGSDERAVDDMLGPPVQFGKLCARLNLATTIPETIWLNALSERFALAGLSIERPAIEKILAFGLGRPYATMTLAREVALAAVGVLGATSVDAFTVDLALPAAQARLDDDQT